MRTEEQVQAALAYYRNLTQRAQAFWDEHPLQVNYVAYQEYMAKRDTLAWLLSETSDEQPDSDYPVHSVFWPDYQANR